MKILVSSCLLGINCKYNGKNNFSQKLQELIKSGNHEVIPVCPEVLGGLPVPRAPAEICNGVVTNTEGVVVDSQFRLGADKALEIAKANRVDMAILQSRSPSCGINHIYDGSFSKTLTKGNGVFAQLLLQNGIVVKDVEEL